MASRVIPSGLIIGAGALLLTGPALVVAHQFLGLTARPEVLVGSLAQGFVRSGQLALGLCPFMLFFSATSGLWGVLLAAILGGIGALGLGWTIHALVHSEPRQGSASPLWFTARNQLTMSGLVACWSGLTFLIALRIAWDVSGFVLGA